MVVISFFEGDGPRNAAEHPLRFTLGEDGYLQRKGQDPEAEAGSYLAE